jgi:replication factor A1
VEALCDVIGVINSVSQIQTFLTKKDQREAKKRTVELIDRSKRAVELTLWGEMAEDFTANRADIITIKNARVNDFQGFKSLNFASSLSSIEINPDMDVAHELKTWYKQNADNIHIEAKSISSGGGGVNNVCPMGNYAELRQGALSNNNDKKGFILRVPSTIMWFKRDDQAPLYYKAVPNDRYKVVENTIDPGNGKLWYCNQLDQFFDTYTPRFILALSGSDFTGSQILACFDDCGSLLLGCDASAVEHLKIHDPPKLELLFEQALFQRKIIKIRAKEEMGDEQKIQYIIYGVEPLDFVKESKNLIEKIRQMQNN